MQIRAIDGISKFSFSLPSSRLNGSPPVLSYHRPRLASLDRLQLPDLLCNFAASPDQVGDEPVVHVEGTFVLSPIPQVVTFRQHSPAWRWMG